MKDNYRQKGSDSPRKINMDLPWRQHLGQLGEQYVTNLLKHAEWKIIERNWRAGRYAEIDIIASDPEKVLVFIEVKTRIKYGDSTGFDNSGFDKLDKRKVQKLLGCARLYMAQCKFSNIQLEQGYRFDAFVLYYPPFQKDDLLNTINNAEIIKPEVQHIMSFLP